jgi:glycosyltransferase involved in cell wall biosynthesis
VKVALVCDWYHPRVGGIELHLQDLARHLSTAGHDVVIITPTPGASAVNGIRVVRVSAPLAPVFHFLATPAGVRAIGRALEIERVDVAHCHVSIISPAALGAAHRAQQRNIPTVLTFHSVVPQTHILARAAAIVLGTSRWRARFTAVSQRVVHDVAAIAGGQPMTVLSNGIDAEFWGSTPSPAPSADLRLVSVMRLNKKKRPLALVDMMRRLPGHPRAVLTIIGDGPERARLQAAADAAQLSDRVRLLGRLDREQIRSVFAATDIFVLPTVRESFGLAALEARCAGLPVVAMKASGVAEFVEHNVGGLLADSDTEFAVHVAGLGQDSERRALMARHNRSTVPPHSWPVVVQEHLRVYSEAMALLANVRAET